MNLIWLLFSLNHAIDTCIAKIALVKVAAAGRNLSMFRYVLAYSMNLLINYNTYVRTFHTCIVYH
jgi:hypothetical protein